MCASLKCPTFCVQIPLCFPRGSTLGRDDNDASRCLRAVNRRCGRACQDLDTFDIVRIDVGDAVYSQILATGETLTPLAFVIALLPGLDDLVIDYHAVDQIERGSIGVDRGDASNLTGMPPPGAPPLFC